MMTTEQGQTYPHLHKKALSQIDLPDAERIRIIQAGSWIALDHAKKALDRIQELLDHPEVTRMPNLLLIGASYSGKTTILEHFVKMHAIDPDPETEVSHIPVLMVEAPPKPHVGDFYSRILEALFAPYKPAAGDEEKFTQIRRLFKQLNVRLLIIDEIHHLIAGGLKAQREFRNALKSLGNMTKVCIVAAGTEEADAAINLDPQLSSRFQPMVMPKWKPGMQLGTLLATLESRMPLKMASNLASPEIVMEIDLRAEQTLGDIFDFVRAAGVDAIRTGQEQITLKQLKQLDWIPPSKRRMYATSI